MKNEIIVKLENISKHYRMYKQNLHQAIEALCPVNITLHKKFTALQDINLEIRRGDSIGIVGRNGSGKSTLLQIISGVLAADQGHMELNGSLAALLELGAGFNPNFTGKENVYLYGSILGMGRDELDAKYEQILNFADIGDFIDQPVKTYSSGMYVRLCFSVAISRQPDILIVDEALAVGDEAFQRKCYKTITDYIDSGNTLIFVSHSAGTVVELCNKAVLLDRGEIISRGSPKKVVANYQKLVFSPKERFESIREDIINGTVRRKAGITQNNKITSDQDGYYDPSIDLEPQVVYESQGAAITDVYISTKQGAKINCLKSGRSYFLNYTVEFLAAGQQVRFGSMFKSDSGIEICGIRSHRDGSGLEEIPEGKIAQIKIPFTCILGAGSYYVNAGVTEVKNNKLIFMHRVIDAVHFKVDSQNNSGLLNLTYQ